MCVSSTAFCSWTWVDHVGPKRPQAASTRVVPSCVSDDFSAEDVSDGLRIHDDVVPCVIVAVDIFDQVPYFGVVLLLAQGDNANEVVK